MKIIANNEFNSIAVQHLGWPRAGRRGQILPLFLRTSHEARIFKIYTIYAQNTQEIHTNTHNIHPQYIQNTLKIRLKKNGK